MGSKDSLRPKGWLNRREILGLGALGTAALLLGRFAKNGFPGFKKTRGLASGEFINDTERSAARPIQEVSPFFRQRNFSGDNPSRAHSVLWKLDLQLATTGAESVEEIDTVIVGGGLSGLIAAYELRTKKPILLEQAPQFGGNAKGEVWQNRSFAIGSSYIAEPEEGSRIDQLLTELGIRQLGRKKDDSVSDPVWVHNQIHPSFWSFEKDPKLAPIYQRVRNHFKEYLDGTNGKVYPNFPVEGPDEWASIQTLDQRSFLDEVRLAAKTDLPAELQNAIEHYAWSSFGAPAQAISAAAAINFYAAELGEIRVFPAGNAAISDTIYTKLHDTLPLGSLRAGALVARVKPEQDHVLISYYDSKDKLRQIRAKNVVMACPKFIARRILTNLDDFRMAVFSELEYSSYLVANLLLDTSPTTQNFYDLYRLDEASGKFVRHGQKDTAAESQAQKSTDLVWTSWPEHNAGSAKSVLSLFRPIPHTHGRAEILDEKAYERYKKEFDEEARHRILPMLKIPAAALQDVRVTRWGHPLPIAKKGLYSNRRLQKACRPIEGRIYFAHQDNWSLPAFENAAAAAFEAADQIKKKAT